jgi:hypothetical protein
MKVGLTSAMIFSRDSINGQPEVLLEQHITQSTKWLKL